MTKTILVAFILYITISSVYAETIKCNKCVIDITAETSTDFVRNCGRTYTECSIPEHSCAYFYSKNEDSHWIYHLYCIDRAVCSNRNLVKDLKEIGFELKLFGCCEKNLCNGFNHLTTAEKATIYKDLYSIPSSAEQSSSASSLLLFWTLGCYLYT